MSSSGNESETKRHTWPRYLLLAVILGFVLSVLAVIKEARRVQSMERVPTYRAPAESPPGG